MSARGRFFRRRQSGGVTGPLMLAVLERPGWEGAAEVVLMDLGRGEVLEPMPLEVLESRFADVTRSGDYLASAGLGRRDRALVDVRRRRREYVEGLEWLERVEAQILVELDATAPDLDDEGAPGARRAGA